MWKIDFKAPRQKPKNQCYDLEFDKDLILQSIATQYHILPSEQDDLRYSDWIELLAGIMDRTPLGRTVQIRMETNREVIKNMTPHELKIRRDWNDFIAQKMAKETDPEAMKSQIAALERMIASAFGKGGGTHA